MRAHAFGRPPLPLARICTHLANPPPPSCVHTQRFSRVSSRPRNGRGMGQNSSPRLVLDLEKQGSKVSSLKWQRKRPKFRGIPCLVLEKAEEKGKIPRLVSSSTSSSLDDPSRTSAIYHELRLKFFDSQCYLFTCLLD